MKRLPPWVWVVAGAVPLVALALLVWAFTRRSIPAVGLTPMPTPGPTPAAPPREPDRPAGPLLGPPPSPPPPVPVVVEPPREPIPPFIAEAADPGAQIVRGPRGVPFVFGFYADGNIRFVDADGGRYAGKAESARARMRESGGTRAFTVQIGVGVDGVLQATFTGGSHDSETLALVPLVGWSVA